MRFVSALAPMIFVATNAAAELRPAPDYYLETLMALSFADQYATACDRLVIDETAMGEAIDTLTVSLAEDGFDDPRTAHEQMDLPPQEETDALIIELVERHDATEDPNASWCEEGFVEIENDTLIGSMLMEATE